MDFGIKIILTYSFYISKLGIMIQIWTTYIANPIVN